MGTAARVDAADQAPHPLLAKVTMEEVTATTVDMNHTTMAATMVDMDPSLAPAITNTAPVIVARVDAQAQAPAQAPAPAHLANLARAVDQEVARVANLVDVVSDL